MGLFFCQPFPPVNGKKKQNFALQVLRRDFVPDALPVETFSEKRRNGYQKIPFWVSRVIGVNDTVYWSQASCEA